MRHKAWNSRHLRLVRKARSGPTTLRFLHHIFQRRLKRSQRRTVTENQMLLIRKYQPQMLWVQLRLSLHVSSLLALMVFERTWVVAVTKNIITMNVNCNTMLDFSSATRTSINSWGTKKRWPTTIAITWRFRRLSSLSPSRLPWPRVWPVKRAFKASSGEKSSSWPGISICPFFLSREWQLKISFFHYHQLKIWIFSNTKWKISNPKPSRVLSNNWKLGNYNN